jgi:hypothetical protein
MFKFPSLSCSHEGRSVNLHTLSWALNGPFYPLNKRLGGLHSESGHGEERIPGLCQESHPGHPANNHFSKRNLYRNVTCFALRIILLPIIILFVYCVLVSYNL